MTIPGFRAEAALGTSAGGYRARWRLPAVGVAAAAPDCFDCRLCSSVCDAYGWDHPNCQSCYRYCDDDCSQIPGPLDP